MHARRERERRHPHRLARSRSQRSVVGNIQPNGQKKTLNTHSTRTRLSSGKIPGPAPGFPPVPLRLRSHTLTSIRRVHTPHALIKRKHIQRKLVPRHEPALAPPCIPTLSGSRRRVRAPGLQSPTQTWAGHAQSMMAMTVRVRGTTTLLTRRCPRVFRHRARARNAVF